MHNLKKYNLTDFLLLLSKQKNIILFIYCLIIFFGGIRFSDINNLYQISLKDNFQNFISQDIWIAYGVSAEYLYDSPMKIILVKIIPSNKLFISFLFLIINFLPFIFLFIKKNLDRVLLISIFIFSPILKILFLNIGSGDGVLVFLILLAFFLDKKFHIALCFFVMGLWHPQQSFFIFFSYFIGSYCMRNEMDGKKFLLCAISMFLSFLVYIYYKQYFFPDIIGRSTTLIENFNLVLLRNINYLFFILLPLVLWFYIFFPKIFRYNFLLYSWILLLIILSLLVLDSTRVLIITLLPIMCFAIRNTLSFSKRSVNNYLLFIIVAINIISPTISWSGKDWMLYYDIVNDICNHFQICLA